MLPTRSSSQQLRFLLMIVCTVTIAGCSRGPTRLPVEGTVTLDGQPIKLGQLNLVPLPNTLGPTAGAPIVDGRFFIASTGGPLEGKFRVEITTAQTTGRKQTTLNFVTGKMEQVDATEQLVPSRYNRESKLTAEVTATGSNKFDFALTSNK